MAQHDCVGFIASASMTGACVLMQGRINIGRVEAAQVVVLVTRRFAFQKYRSKVRFVRWGLPAEIHVCVSTYLMRQN